MINSYWADEDLESVHSCVICGHPAPATIAISGVADYWEGVPGVWSFRKCDKCASFFLDPRPVSSSLGKAYRSYYTHVQAERPGDEDSRSSFVWRLANGYLNTRYGTCRNPALKVGYFLIGMMTLLREQLDYYYRKLPKQPGRLLDVGCGNGLFLLRAKDVGWDVEGVEPDKMAAESAVASGLDIFCGTIEDYQSSHLFDMITASHVIEHIYDPDSFASRLRRLLKPGGVLWLCTPNASGLGRRLYGRYWRGLEASRHLSIFSPAALVRTLHDAGFESVQLHCRGRGARFILEESQRYASSQGGWRFKRIPVWTVDSLASFFPTWGEEIVVTATNPVQKNR